MSMYCRLKLKVFLLLCTGSSLIALFWVATSSIANNKQKDISHRHYIYFNTTGSRDIGCSYTGRQNNSNLDQASKLILFHSFPDFYTLKSSKSIRLFEKCDVDCEFSVDVSRLPEANAVILYSHTELSASSKRYFLEKQLRSERQIWGFFAVESPVYSKNEEYGKDAWRGKFNWTVSYRHDSDFWFGYVETVKREKPLPAATFALIEHKLRFLFRKKKKLVAWFVSHCNSNSKRDDYVKDLQKYINVDIYGTCSKRPCNGMAKCLKMLSRDYKFYLSFENSLCKDYATEKLHRILKLKNVVPVVRGGADYHRLFPKESLVNTADFESPKALANHLLTLAVDEDAYVKKFRWLRTHEIQGPVLPLCQMCQRLNSPLVFSCTYDNVYTWWTQGMCYQPDDISTTSNTSSEQPLSHQ